MKKKGHLNCSLKKNAETHFQTKDLGKNVSCAADRQPLEIYTLGEASG